MRATTQGPVNLAPGWTIQCPKCGLSKPYGAARWGILRPVRLGAASIGKRTLGWCSQCRRLCWAKVFWTGDQDRTDDSKKTIGEADLA